MPHTVSEPARHPWLALAEHDRPFRALLDQMPVGMTLAEARQRRTVLINQAGRAILGDDVADALLRGEDMISRFRDDAGRPLPASQCPMTLAAAGEVVDARDLQFERTDDDRRWLRISAAPVHDAAGYVAGVAMCFYDVGREKQTRRDLDASNRYLQTLLDASPLSITVLDRAGIVRGWNPASERMFGYAADEVIDRENPVVPPDRRTEFRKNIATVMDAGGIMGYETRRKRRDGQEIDVTLWAAPLRFNGDPPDRLISICADVTDVKRARQQLQQLTVELEQRVAQRTAQLRALTSELTHVEQRERQRLAQILHDHLQQILVAATFQLARSTRFVESDKGRDQLKKVDEMIQSAISASRSLSIELYPPVLHDGGLRPALEWLAGQMQEQYQLAVGLEMDHDLELGEDLRVMVFHVVRELLFNVVKHAGVPEATLAVHCPEPDRLEVVVADRGKGCDPQSLFEQDQQHGFGLLSIRERVAGLGGAFDVDSSPGAGCRTTVTLPMTVDQDPVRDLPTDGTGRSRRRPRSRTRSGRLRVLLVDDHRIVREGLAGLIRDREDMEVIGEAENGEQAVAMAAQLRPDVVVMDVNMPGMNGIDACRAIHREDPSVRVVGLSMHGEDHVADAMREAGAAAFVSKGGPMEQLVSAITAQTA